MTRKETEARRLYSYLTAIGLVTAACYLCLIMWLAIRSPEVLNHEDKVVALMMVIVLPGRLLLERVFNLCNSPERQRVRISGMLFVGLLVGLYSTKGTTDFLGASVEFVMTFPWAAAVYIVLDAVNAKTFAVWSQRKKNVARA
ncbi:hypothetical protein [Thalassococcus lentus]|uniref:Uncharacterized protein n=1 Tax=Thalassococcus lentus TaxID=1210524 RepID=A0ABT4XPP7_9RHOB|nr:hypothetical protein [Thalassococcus lentus]MDA7423924.1 hypothetical protein [Thalassococcus lentus]